MGQSMWTSKEIKALKKSRDEGFEWDAIASQLQKSESSCRQKYRRMNWDTFDGSPVDKHSAKVQPWTHTDMAQLDAFLKVENCSYSFIADKLDRSVTSVERKAQTTDWKAWRELTLAPDEEEEIAEEDKEALLAQLVSAMLEIIRNDPKNLKSIRQSDFLERVNLDADRLFLSFSELKKHVEAELEKLGYGNPESVEMGPGTYVIVGDSHGKHTKKAMFALLKQVNKELKPKKIIHLGHILDDDNDISYEWGNFDNLAVLAKMEELRLVQDKRSGFKFNFDVIRDNIRIGDLMVFNQDMISDYVKTPLTSLDSEIFDEKMIVNSHRLEFFTRNFHDGMSYSASPGCLCENHIIRTIKQMDFTDGRTVKQANHDGFSKYRRMRHTNLYWEMGMLIVSLDKSGNITVVPCPIQETSKGFTMSYFDKIIASKGVYNPTKKILINGDLHCDNHDIGALDVQEKIAKDYKPDVYVNLGDTFNYASLNHHAMDRGEPILDKQILDEAASTYFVLKRLSGWAKETHMIYGNHERFAKDFTKKFPQFGDLLDFNFLCSLEKLGYELTDLKDVLKIGSANFVHGDIIMYNQPGSKIEKISRTFGSNTFIGHIHKPSMRFGCCSLGLSGKEDQGYNEPAASDWSHGFGLCNQFEGKSWSTTIAIVDHRCVLGGKTYKPANLDTWRPKKYKAALTFDF